MNIGNVLFNLFEKGAQFPSTIPITFLKCSQNSMWQYQIETQVYEWFLVYGVPRIHAH